MYHYQPCRRHQVALPRHGTAALSPLLRLCPKTQPVGPVRGAAAAAHWRHALALAAAVPQRWMLGCVCDERCVDSRARLCSPRPPRPEQPPTLPASPAPAPPSSSRALHLVWRHRSVARPPRPARRLRRQCRPVVAPSPAPISYTESYQDLQQSDRDVQESYRTRDFELECSISAPVRSTIHRNGTYPTLKTFPCFFNYRSFEGVEAPEGCENVA